ncbi:MAG: hypothetical protein NC212_10670 [Staphylococcus sp.]|nr:hypothetical protein [Staphylococcus sp.]
MEKTNKKEKEVKSSQKYPGVSVNIADDNKVNPEMVKNDVKELNNNPRNNDL